jgi:hypothetical protein
VKVNSDEALGKINEVLYEYLNDGAISGGTQGQGDDPSQHDIPRPTEAAEAITMIDLTPTWLQTVNALLVLYESGSTEARALARLEFKKMAGLADALKMHHENHARLREELRVPLGIIGEVTYALDQAAKVDQPALATGFKHQADRLRVATDRIQELSEQL